MGLEPARHQVFERAAKQNPGIVFADDVADFINFQVELLHCGADVIGKRIVQGLAPVIAGCEFYDAREVVADVHTVPSRKARRSATIRDTVGWLTPKMRAISAADLRPEVTLSAISARCLALSFGRRPPTRPSDRA